MSETRTMTGFAGKRVVAFESRYAEEMKHLIERQGGVPIIAPSMAEVPLSQNVAAFEFAERLMRGELQLVVFMTGVGTRTLAEVLETRFSKEEILGALRKVTVVARGPKPVSALRRWGVPITITVPEPNTWRELLETLDSTERCPPLQGLRIAVQEYGVPNRELIEGLKQRGAEVVQVPVYRWTLPADTQPLREAIRAILDGLCDAALFTNAMQVNHLFQVAQQMGEATRLRETFTRVVVASVGPTCSDELRRNGLSVDLEPHHPKMGQLVKEAAERSADLLSKKRQVLLQTSPGVGRAVQGPVQPLPVQDEGRERWESSPFMRACRHLPTDYPPIWLMRQAGRYMPEYREIRSRHSFLELCKDSDLAAEVTVTAAHRLGVDAAIIFADILLIVEPMGLGLRFERGDGPVIDGMVRSRADIERLREIDPEESLGFVFDAIRKTRAGLRADIPLIGFAAAPFTLASYITEGGASKNYRHTKGLMYRDAAAWHFMMELISRGLIRYLNGQIAAGAQAVQLFDSWAGCLRPEDYREFVLPHTRRVIEGITSGVPVINFSTGTSGYLELVRQAGGSVIGIDWRVDLAEAWARIGHEVGIMGNLDPVILFSDPATVVRKAEELLRKAAGRPGYIFNLGHGILPETPVENALALVEAVHRWRSSEGI